MYIKQDKQFAGKISENNSSSSDDSSSNASQASDEKNIDPNNLLKYISLGDFGKVEQALQIQIHQDQEIFNKDISASLSNLSKLISDFNILKEKLYGQISTLNKLISYVEGKNYFIKGFEDVKFILSESNDETLKNLIFELQKAFSDDDISNLLYSIKHGNVYHQDTLDSLKETAGNMSDSSDTSESFEESITMNDSPVSEDIKINNDNNEISASDTVKNLFDSSDLKSGESNPEQEDSSKQVEENSFDIKGAFGTEDTIGSNLNNSVDDEKLNAELNRLTGESNDSLVDEESISVEVEYNSSEHNPVDDVTKPENTDELQYQEDNDSVTSESFEDLSEPPVKHALRFEDFDFDDDDDFYVEDESTESDSGNNSDNQSNNQSSPENNSEERIPKFLVNID